MSGGFREVFLLILLSYPMLIGSIIVFLVPLCFLLIKRKAMKREVKIILAIATVVAGALVSFLVFLMFAFGSNHPTAPPEPVMTTPPAISIYDFDGNQDMRLGDKLIVNESGDVVLKERVFILMDIPDGTMKYDIFYAARGNDSEQHMLMSGEYSAPHRKQNEVDTHPAGCGFLTASILSEGMHGSIWAVTADANGVEFISNVIEVTCDSEDSMPK